MRDVDPAIVTALEARQITPFLLFRTTIDSIEFCYTDCDVPIVLDGKRYLPRGFDPGGISRSSGNVVDELTITIDDTDSLLTATFLEGDVQGADAVLSLVVLDSALAIVGGVEEILFQGTIDSWTLQAERSVAVTLSSPLVAWNRSCASIHASSCRWMEFKGTRCGYAGSETWCDRSYARCTALANTDNFGGFRWLPSLENKDIWWGRTQG